MRDFAGFVAGAEELAGAEPGTAESEAAEFVAEDVRCAGRRRVVHSAACSWGGKRMHKATVLGDH